MFVLDALDWLLGAIALLWARARGRRLGDGLWTWDFVRFYPLDPRPAEYRDADVARGLAGEGRYSNQIRHYYSVAEHSVLVSLAAEALAIRRGLEPGLARAAAWLGLYHDLSEAYLRDLPRPIKYSGPLRGYRRIERRVQRVGEAALVESHVGPITDEVRAIVHEVDNRILVDEVRALSRNEQMIARISGKYGPAVLEPLGIELKFYEPRHAEAAWWRRRDALAVGRTAGSTSSQVYS
jgi:5'-deoxynucleotidase YfbR-like HD superfamily hydrolase